MKHISVGVVPVLKDDCPKYICIAHIGVVKILGGTLNDIKYPSI
jgi:hypothetical protein